MNTKVWKRFVITTVVAGLSISGLLLLVSSAKAATRTWNGNGGANLSVASSWDINTVPAANDFFFFGSTDTTGASISNDLANAFSFGGITFNSGAVAYTFTASTPANVYVLEATPTGTGISNLSTQLQTINFNFSTTTAQTINTTSGGGNITLGGVVSGAGGLTLAGTGTLNLTAANTYTGATTTATGSVLKLANVSAIQNSLLTDGANGTVAFDTTTAGGTTFNIGGLTGTGNIALTDFSNSSIAVTASIGGSNGAPAAYTGDLSGIGGVTKVGTGTLSFGANQDYTGATIVNTGSITATGNMASQSLTVNGGSLSITGAASATQLNIGNGSFVAGTGDNFTSGTYLTALTGANIGTSATVAGSGVLALNAITRTTGSGVNFTLPTSGSITTINANTGSSILGGWATVGGTDWAVSAGNGSTAGAITALASYTNDTWSSGNNTTVTLASNSVSASTTNSLRFGTAAADTVTLSGTNTITSGGILNSSAVGNNASVITGGSLHAASGGELVLNQQDSANTLTIGSSIVDNGTSALTKLGAGSVILTGSNSYAGPTNVSVGTLQIGNGGTSGTIGAGSIAVGPTGSLVFDRSDSVSLANVISGTGTVAIANPTGSLTLTNANAFTGTLAVNTGSLTLDFTSSALSNNIVGSTTTASLGGGTLNINGGASGATNSQTFGALALSLGSSVLNINSGSSGGTMNVNLGALTTAVGSTLEINGPTSGTVTASPGSGVVFGAVANPVSGAPPAGTGIIQGSASGVNKAPFVTYGLSDFAATTATSGTANIVPGSTIANFYQTGVPASNSNTATVFDATAPYISGTSTIAIYGMRFNTPAANSFTIRDNFGAGGILVTPNMGANNLSITLGAGGVALEGSRDSSNSELVFWQNNGAAETTINAVIADKATGSSQYTIYTQAGQGTVILDPKTINNAATTVNSYSGASYLDGGYTEITRNGSLGGNTLNVTSSSTSSNSVTISAANPAPPVGSGLLGQTVVSVSGTTVTLSGNANATISTSTAVSFLAPVNISGGAIVGSGSSFSLDAGASSANAFRPITLAQNFSNTLAATTGNAMTVSGVVSDRTSGAPGALLVGTGTLAGTGTNDLGQNGGVTANAAVIGNGTVILSGGNTYTGGTTVVNGALYANNAAGSATGTGNVTVTSSGLIGGGNSGGTLGFITGSVSLQTGAQIAPGNLGVTSSVAQTYGSNGMGTLKVGGLSFSTGSIYDVDLSGSSGSDRVIATNGLNVASGAKVNLFTSGQGTVFSNNGTYTLFDVTGGSVPSAATLQANFGNPLNETHGTYTWGTTSDGSGGTDVTLTVSGLTPVYNWVAGNGVSDWQTGGNWDQAGAVPGSAGDAVSFHSGVGGSSATGATSIKLNSTNGAHTVTVGSITFNDTAAQFSIDPGTPTSSLILNNNGQGASIVDTSGTHAITANIALADNLTLTGGNPGDKLTISGSISGGNNASVTNGNGGTVILTGANSYANTNIDSGNALQIGDGVSTNASLGTGNVTLNGTLTINRPNSYNVTNAIGGSTGALVLAGAGTTTLSGANSGAWSTTVNSGTLQIGSGSTLGTGNLTMSGGVLDLNGASPTVNSLSGSGTIDNVSSTTPSTLTLTQNSNTVFSGIIQNTAGPSGGTVSLVKGGTGDLTLSGTGNYDGGTTINDGQIIITSSSAIKAGSTITVVSTAASGTNNGGLILSGNINLGANVDFTPNAGNATGSVFDVATGSAATISGNISNTGNPSNAQLRISAGGIGTDTTTSLTITGNATFSVSAPDFFLERGNFIIANSGQFNDTTTQIIGIGRNSGNLATFTAKDNSQVNVGALTLAVTGATTSSVTFTVQDNAAVTVAVGGVGGNLDLNNEGAATTTTLNLNGGTLNVGGFTQGGSFATTTTGGTAFNLNGGTIVVGAANDIFIPVINASSTNTSFNQPGPVVQAGGAKFNTNGFAATIVAPLVHDPNLVGTDGGLTKTGAGTLTLGDQSANLSSTYNGPTTVTQGTLALGISNAISNQSNIVLNGGTLSAGGHSQSLSTLQLQSSSSLDLGTGGHDNPEDVQFANSSAVSWSGILRVNDWQGTPVTGGGPDEVLFGSSSGLTAGQLSKIHFNDYLTGAKFVGSSGEIVPASATRLLLGDVNGNGHANAGDILPFEQALANLNGYETAHGYDFADVQDIMDINHDGLVNNADLTAFLGFLQGGQGNLSPTVPEPSSLVLLGLALPAVWTAYRRRRTRA